MTADTQSSIVLVSDRPNVGDLINEFKRSGSHGDHFGRMRTAEDTRLARWDGQSPDGKKHAEALSEGDEPFPWEGASDVRNFLADGAVNETVALLYMAFWSAVLKIAPGTEKDFSDSATATTYLDWMVRFQLHRMLDVEVELAAQYMQNLGVTGLHVTWEREVGRKLVKVSLDDLVKMSMATGGVDPNQLPPEEAQLLAVLQVLPELIADPNAESEAVKALQYVFDEYVRRNMTAELDDSDVLLLSDKRARAAVRSLRKQEAAELPMPYLCKNQPRITALKPFRDLVMPAEVGASEEAPVMFVRSLFTEANLRKMQLTDGWDADWIAEAVKTKGKFSTWEMHNPYSQHGTWSWRAVDNGSWFIEVVYAYRKQVDEDGVTQLQYTVFSPHLTKNPKAEGGAQDDFCGKHGILNNPRPEYPVILGRRERLDRSWLATRGFAEILHTDQNVEKAMTDNVVDLASISTVPPLHVPKGMATQFKIGPAVQNEYKPGYEAKFMDIPTKGMTPAVEVIEAVRAKMARYCGLFHDSVPPQLAAIMQQPMVKKFLIMWGEALQMAYELSVKFAPEQIERVTGSAPSRNVDDFHYVMHFDAMQFQPELMEAKLKAFDEIAATDPTGTIDRVALTNYKARMVDPAMARELIVGQAQASVRLKRDVMNDLLNMFAGTEALYEDASNDPTAATKLQMAQELIQSNPNYVGSLDPQVVAEIFGPDAGMQVADAQRQGAGQANARFSALVQNYVKHLQQGVAQQENKLIGRTGVRPLT